MSAPTCLLCGHVADIAEGDPPLGWSSDHVDADPAAPPRWICPTCTRRYVRSIEAKLDENFW